MNRDGILSGGARLQEFLDGMPIEARWLAGHHIVWQTGQQNGPDDVGPDDHTHCSALAAAIALDLDILSSSAAPSPTAVTLERSDGLARSNRNVFRTHSFGFEVA
jgi:hypothetical protein